MTDVSGLISSNIQYVRISSGALSWGRTTDEEVSSPTTAQALVAAHLLPASRRGVRVEAPIGASAVATAID